MELIPRNGCLFDTTVFIDYERERPAALELIQQSRLPGVSVCYSFITYWELRLGRTDDWTDEDLYQALRPYPMIGLPPTSKNTPKSFSRRSGRRMSVVRTNSPCPSSTTVISRRAPISMECGSLPQTRSTPRNFARSMAPRYPSICIPTTSLKPIQPRNETFADAKHSCKANSPILRPLVVCDLPHTSLCVRLMLR